MKLFTFAFTALALVCLASGKKAAGDTIPPEGRIVDIHSQNLFIPVGFDDNDELVVVLDGYLPDTCFKVAPALVTRDLEHKQIIVEQRAREFPGTCFDMLVPFTTVIKLGVLPPGNYSVVTNRGKLTESLSIKRSSSSSPDDYLYAPVATVGVEERTGGNFVAVLKGRFTNSCAAIEKVVITNHEKTIEVMPVMVLNSSSEENCEPKLIPFTREVALPRVGPGSHLLHVRSLDGQSLNVVFEGLPVSNIQ